MDALINAHLQQLEQLGVGDQEVGRAHGDEVEGAAAVPRRRRRPLQERLRFLQGVRVGRLTV